MSRHKLTINIRVDTEYLIIICNSDNSTSGRICNAKAMLMMLLCRWSNAEGVCGSQDSLVFEGDNVGE